MLFPVLVLSRGLWMYSFTLDLGKPQRMVQIWEGWECNVWTRKSTPRPKGWTRLMWNNTKDMPGAMSLLFASPACWRLPLVLALQSAILLLTRMSQGMLPAVGRAGQCWQFELCLWFTGCLIPKAPGFQDTTTRNLLGQEQPASSIWCFWVLLFTLTKNALQQIQGLLHLLSSKFSSPRWDLLCFFYTEKKEKCCQLTHSLAGFNRSKEKHLECDRRITVINTVVCGRTSLMCWELCKHLRLLRESATQAEMFENVFFLTNTFP